MGAGFYRNGRFYGGSIPNGGTAGQVLTKRTNLNGDVAWADISGIIFTYIVGNTPYAVDWLSLSVSGTALVPDPKMVYLILTAGDYYHNFVRWDQVNTTYLPIVSGGDASGGGAIFSYIDLTKTAFDDDWLVDAEGTTIEPEEGLLYLILTAGEYKNSIYRFDETTEKYIPVYRNLQFTAMPTATASYDGLIVQYIGSTDANYTHGYFYECVNTGGTRSWVNRQVQECEKVQVATMPAASADLLGVVYQYIGVTTSSYVHNYFYECKSDGATPPVYSWVAVPVQRVDSIQLDTIPTASADYVGKLVQYIGTTNATYTHGYFYECKSDGATPPVYSWDVTSVQENESIQVTSIPTADATLVGVIYQYVGTTTSTYNSGWFYECVEDSSTNPVSYKWVNKNVQDGGTGHSIKSGETSYTNRRSLNFKDFDVSDDSENDETVVQEHVLLPEELSEIFSGLPASNPNIYTVYDERGNEFEVGQLIKSDGTTATVYERWLEVTVPVAVVTELTESLVSIGSSVDRFLDVRGMVEVDGWFSNIVWGAPNLSVNGIMLSAYSNDDTSGNANKAGIFYNGDVTAFDRIVVIVRYTKVAE